MARRATGRQIAPIPGQTVVKVKVKVEERVIVEKEEKVLAVNSSGGPPRNGGCSSIQAQIALSGEDGSQISKVRKEEDPQLEVKSMPSVRHWRC